MQFTPEEEEEFAEMARSEGFYERFAKSVAPSIYGCLGMFPSCRTSIHHLWHSDIKKAIACLLFGGSKKILPDGMRLRGDINVLLLGDPGTAKSQLLKFVEKVGFVIICPGYWLMMFTGCSDRCVYFRQGFKCSRSDSFGTT